MKTAGRYQNCQHEFKTSFWRLCYEDMNKITRAMLIKRRKDFNNLEEELVKRKLKENPFDETSTLKLSSSLDYFHPDNQTPSRQKYCD